MQSYRVSHRWTKQSSLCVTRGFFIYLGYNTPLWITLCKQPSEQYTWQPGYSLTPFYIQYGQIWASAPLYCRLLTSYMISKDVIYSICISLGLIFFCLLFWGAHLSIHPTQAVKDPLLSTLCGMTPDNPSPLFSRVWDEILIILRLTVQP